MQGVVEIARYRELAAPPGLGLVCLWGHGHPGPGPLVQNVVPDGCMDLIWWSRGARIMVAGPDTGAMPTTIAPGDRLLGVRFGPGAAPPVLGVPADAVRDARPWLRELWGTEADRLGEAVATAEDPFTPLVEAVRARRAGAPDPLVSPLVSGLAAGGVRTVADALGVSERQLRRRAHAAFGYGPKTLQRVLRFQRALRLARAGTPPAEAAYTAGYADQAHMANEVRELGGARLRDLI